MVRCLFRKLCRNIKAYWGIFKKQTEIRKKFVIKPIMEQASVPELPPHGEQALKISFYGDDQSLALNNPVLLQCLTTRV